MAAPKMYPVEVRDRSVRLVEDLLADPDLQLPVTGACARVAEQLGINRDTVRGWVKQAQIDAGSKPGLSTDQHRRLKELEAENRELRRANAILKDRVGFLRGGARPPIATLVRFIDEHRHDTITVGEGEHARVVVGQRTASFLAISGTDTRSRRLDQALTDRCHPGIPSLSRIQRSTARIVRRVSPVACLRSTV